jgi:hypothetical protein
VSPTDLRHWCDDDPLLDWLDLYGDRKGFARDAAADPRTDFQAFVVNKAREFEPLVVARLSQGRPVTRIAQTPDHCRSIEHAAATIAAMEAGTELISQAVLWDAEAQRYGVADLLVRSDTLRSLFPGLMEPEAASPPAPLLPGARWHYRVVEIKYKTLHLNKNGTAGADHTFAALQAWVYNEALGRLQGFTPDAAFLLGRRWRNSASRGTSALERLARVEQAGRPSRNGPSFADVTAAGSGWIRRVRNEGHLWSVLPVPSVEELRPNMRQDDDYPWHAAKKTIGDALEDLTLLPRVTPERRAQAIAAGISRWTDAGSCAAVLGLGTPAVAPVIDAVISANRPGGAAVQPAHIAAAAGRWRTPAPVEFYVDFETVSDLDDDFTNLPVAGGQPLIFMIGCGQALPNGMWDFRVFTARRLNEAEEGRVIEEWLAHMNQVCATNGVALEQARIFHWSAAETATLSTAYNSAAARHGLPTWDEFPWVDLLTEVVKAEPVTVRGAFAFGLKALAKAMHGHGLIATGWPDGPTDGLGAMTGAWWCEGQARRSGTDMTAFELMREIEDYNEVDCRAMAEILDYLRQHH